MKKILAIDDDNSIRMTIKDILELDGFEVDEAEDGYIAIEKTRSK